MGAHLADLLPRVGRPETQCPAAAAGQHHAAVRQVRQAADPVAVRVAQRQHLFAVFQVPNFDAGVARAGHERRAVHRQTLDAVVVRRIQIEPAPNQINPPSDLATSVQNTTMDLRTPYGPVTETSWTPYGPSVSPLLTPHGPPMDPRGTLTGPKKVVPGCEDAVGAAAHLEDFDVVVLGAGDDVLDARLVRRGAGRRTDGQAHHRRLVAAAQLARAAELADVPDAHLSVVPKSTVVRFASIEDGEVPGCRRRRRGRRCCGCSGRCR